MRIYNGSLRSKTKKTRHILFQQVLLISYSNIRANPIHSLRLREAEVLLFQREEKRVTGQLTILEAMSQKKEPRLDLKLNLSPPKVSNPRVESPSQSSPTSPTRSCVSSLETNQQDEGLQYSTSPEATSMMLAGCPRCLMYVMLTEEDPRCPKCKSTVLLDVSHDRKLTTKKTK